MRFGEKCSAEKDEEAKQKGEEEREGKKYTEQPQRFATAYIRSPIPLYTVGILVCSPFERHPQYQCGILLAIFSSVRKQSANECIVEGAANTCPLSRGIAGE